MSTKKQIAETSGVYFITFTCHQWLPLFAKTNGYQVVYKWFDYLKGQGHHIVGYVIMPNHIHALVAFTQKGKSVNTIVGNAKRFMAYELVHLLKENNEVELLQTLAIAVSPRERGRGKQHQVFEPSFDWKECRTPTFIKQKLDYIHANPCRGIWQLVDSPVNYPHSSARYYLLGVEGVYPVLNYGALQDMDLTNDAAK